MSFNNNNPNTNGIPTNQYNNNQYNNNQYRQQPAAQRPYHYSGQPQYYNSYYNRYNSNYHQVQNWNAYNQWYNQQDNWRRYGWCDDYSQWRMNRSQQQQLRQQQQQPNNCVQPPLPRQSPPLSRPAAPLPHVPPPLPPKPHQRLFQRRQPYQSTSTPYHRDPRLRGQQAAPIVSGIMENLNQISSNQEIPADEVKIEDDDRWSETTELVEDITASYVTWEQTLPGAETEINNTEHPSIEQRSSLQSTSRSVDSVRELLISKLNPANADISTKKNKDCLGSNSSATVVSKVKLTAPQSRSNADGSEPRKQAPSSSSTTDKNQNHTSSDKKRKSSDDNGNEAKRPKSKPLPVQLFAIVNTLSNSQCDEECNTLEIQQETLQFASLKIQDVYFNEAVVCNPPLAAIGLKIRKIDDLNSKREQLEVQSRPATVEDDIVLNQNEEQSVRASELEGASDTKNGSSSKAQVETKKKTKESHCFETDSFADVSSTSMFADHLNSLKTSTVTTKSLHDDCHKTNSRASTTKSSLDRRTDRNRTNSRLSTRSRSKTEYSKYRKRSRSSSSTDRNRNRRSSSSSEYKKRNSSEYKKDKIETTTKKRRLNSDKENPEVDTLKYEEAFAANLRNSIKHKTDSSLGGLLVENVLKRATPSLAAATTKILNEFLNTSSVSNTENRDDVTPKPPLPPPSPNLISIDTQNHDDVAPKPPTPPPMPNLISNLPNTINLKCRRVHVDAANRFPIWPAPLESNNKITSFLPPLLPLKKDDEIEQKPNVMIYGISSEDFSTMVEIFSLHLYQMVRAANVREQSNKLWKDLNKLPIRNLTNLDEAVANIVQKVQEILSTSSDIPNFFADRQNFFYCFNRIFKINILSTVPILESLKHFCQAEFYLARGRKMLGQVSLKSENLENLRNQIEFYNATNIWIERFLSRSLTPLMQPRRAWLQELRSQVPVIGSRVDNVEMVQVQMNSDAQRQIFGGGSGGEFSGKPASEHLAPLEDSEEEDMD